MAVFWQEVAHIQELRTHEGRAQLSESVRTVVGRREDQWNPKRRERLPLHIRQDARAEFGQYQKL